MPKFVCSYAYDIACYSDFVVEAKTEKAALRRIRKALREGRFENVSADPCWENGPDNERVFVQGPATEFAPSTTLDELTGREHLFSSTRTSAFAAVNPRRTTQLKTSPVPAAKPQPST